MNWKRTCALLLVTVLILLISGTQLFAQGLPCDGADPDIDCPVDTPIFFLATAILLLSIKKITEAHKQLK